MKWGRVVGEFKKYKSFSGGFPLQDDEKFIMNDTLGKELAR
jgi:hypothetical protein